MAWTKVSTDIRYSVWSSERSYIIFPAHNIHLNGWRFLFLIRDCESTVQQNRAICVISFNPKYRVYVKVKHSDQPSFFWTGLTSYQSSFWRFSDVRHNQSSRWFAFLLSGAERLLISSIWKIPPEFTHDKHRQGSRPVNIQMLEPLSVAGLYLHFQPSPSAVP
jgi:hypothetical protein